MKIWKTMGLFSIGGGSYIGLELLWRGYSHVSMFWAGGVCFLLLGKIGALPLPRLPRAAVGAAAITGVELLTGLLVNRNFRVWDYRGQPGNLLGQICPMYTLLWVPVALGGMALYHWLENRIFWAEK